MLIPVDGVASGVGAGAGLSATTAKGSLDGGDADRVSTDLLIGYGMVAGQSVDGLTASLVASDSGAATSLLTDDQGRVGVDITTSDAEGLAPYLQALGMDVVSILPEYNQVQGFLPWSALPAASELAPEGLMGIIGVATPESNVGLVTSQGVNVVEADRVQASTPGYNGAGVKVGVLSDSYNNKNGAAADIANNDLPASGVQVIQDQASGGSDEGRAMLQIVHDVAPGASLAFATASAGEGQFAANIRALANAGANVITDDETYFDEPFFQEGMIAQAVDSVATTQGVSYFSSAGNFASQGYDSASPLAYGSGTPQFITTTIPSINASPSSYYNFTPGGSNPYQTFSLANGGGVNISFEWDQPYYTTGGVTSDLDIYIINKTTGAVVASSTADNLANQTPFERVFYQNASGSTQNLELAINLYAGTVPGRIKLVNYGSNQFGNVAFSPTTNSSTITPHAGSPNAAAVAAAPAYNQLVTEGFSSYGPTTLLFDASGNRLATPLVVSKPNITAPDGVDTTFFGSDSDTDGYPNFFGTSAAAPHAAGVAALYLQARPNSSPTQVYAALAASATPNVTSGNANVPSGTFESGAGLIDAYKAIFGTPVPASPTLVDGFESGALGGDWEVYKSGAARVQVTTANGPSSGNYHLVLDAEEQYNTTVGVYYNNPPVLDEAILHLNLAGRAGVTIAFDDKKFTNPYEATIAAMPASFAGHGNYDGVSFSVDGGTTWYRLIDLAKASTTYTTQSLNLSQVAASLGLTLTADTRVKFQDYDSREFQAPNSGLAFDNIKATALTQLTQSVIENGAVQRSAVRTITLTFLGHVATIPSSAFALTRTEDGLTVPVVASTPTFSGTSSTVTLTFGGSNLNGTSLPDGRYVLTIDGSKILDDAGNTVDAADNGVPGSVQTLNFYRFFGDAKGNGVVDASDYLVFLAAYQGGNAAGINSIFDYDGNGVINSTDLGAFLLRFRQRTLP